MTQSKAANDVPGIDVVPWPLSARDPAALRGRAAALAERVSSGAWSAAGVARSLLRTRSSSGHRAIVVGERRDELVAGVEALAAGRAYPGLIGPAPAAPPRMLAWLFSGQGGRRVGMGADLYVRFPAFAGAFDAVCEHFDDRLGHPLGEVVFLGGKELLDLTAYARAGMFALQVALARLLAAFGVAPDVAIGRSAGEIAAAHVSGILGLTDACRLVAARAEPTGRFPASPVIDPVLAEFAAAIGDLDHREPAIPLISNLDGDDDTPPAPPGPPPGPPHGLPEIRALAQALARLDIAGTPVDWTTWFTAG